MKRLDGRECDQVRPIDIQIDFVDNPTGSALIRMGRTMVLCTVHLGESVPAFLRGTGRGWITAEYSLLPGSTDTRNEREASRGRVSGRTQEIQRLIGRSLRAVADLESLGERCLYADCDVLQADGGTRTAAISGAYVALAGACNRLVERGLLKRDPLRDSVAAVSCGILGGDESHFLFREGPAPILVRRRNLTILTTVHARQLLLLPLGTSRFRFVLTVTRSDHLGVIIPESDLVTVRTTTDVHVPVREEEQSVVSASANLDDAGASGEVRRRQGGDPGRGRDDLFPTAVVLVDAGLVERVEPPRKDLAVLVDRERVVRARADEHNVLERETLRRQAVLLVACFVVAERRGLTSVPPSFLTAVRRARERERERVRESERRGEKGGRETCAK